METIKVQTLSEVFDVSLSSVIGEFVISTPSGQFIVRRNQHTIETEFDNGATVSIEDDSVFEAKVFSVATKGDIAKSRKTFLKTYSAME